MMNQCNFRGKEISCFIDGFLFQQKFEYIWKKKLDDNDVWTFFKRFLSQDDHLDLLNNPTLSLGLMSHNVNFAELHIIHTLHVHFMAQSKHEKFHLRLHISNK